MRIVDAQVHIWLPESTDRPWPKDGRVKPHLEGGFAIERLLDMMDAAGVERAVLVPPSWEGERIDYVLDAARLHPRRFAAMARIGVDDPAMHGRLRDWLAQPGMLGARLTFTRPAERAWLADGTARWIWAEAEKVGMPLMVHAPADMEKLDAIAARHPRLKLIVDHMGVYQMNSGDADFATALTRTRALARRPNVHVKLSALPHYSVEAYPFLDLRLHLRAMVDAYGARRCFWGTDLTKLLGKGHDYRACIDHLLGLDFLTKDDRTWIMGRGLLECLAWD